jgi:hypothetical protein
MVKITLDVKKCEKCPYICFVGNERVWKDGQYVLQYDHSFRCGIENKQVEPYTVPDWCPEKKKEMENEKTWGC